MRIFLLILLLGQINASAETYYVSNSGNDANNGASTGTSWQTISKVNSTIISGDSVLFNKGDTWTERINVSGSDIYFGSYGIGVKPVVTGLQTVSGFTNFGNIWSASISNSVAYLNTVLINNQIKAKGRYPNTGYLTFTSYSGKTQITGSLTGTPNYTGAECVVRSAHWILDVVKISSQSGGTLNFSSELTYVPSLGGNGYFIQNAESVLDVSGEWYFDSTNKVIKIYSTTSPNAQISIIDTLVYINNKYDITFDGIAFTGANKAAIQIDTCNRVTIKNCTFNYSGTLAISGKKSAYVTVDNDSIQNSLSGAIYLRRVDPYTPMQDTCEYATITNNYIKNTGHLPGMGMSSNGRYIGLYIVGTQPTITGNRFDSTGYVPIFFNGANSYVYKNYVSNFGFVKDDGGGIYTVVGNYIPANYNDGSVVRRNIVNGGIGALAGTSSASFAAGIYLDNLTNDITVDSNTVFNCYTAGVFFNEASSIPFRENTITNDIGAALTVSGANANVTNLGIKKNTLYSQSASQLIINRRLGTSMATTDSNYYARPLNEAGAFSRNGTLYDLAGWKGATSQDAHSVGVPGGVTTDPAVLYYNTTNSNIIYPLIGNWLSSKSVSYSGTITIAPFTSALLYKVSSAIIYSKKLIGLKYKKVKK